MHENTVKKTALIVFLTGLIIISITNINSEPKEDEYFTVTGRVISVSQNDKTAFIKLEHITQSDVIVFKSEELDIKQNDTIYVKGNKDDGSMIAHTIRLYKK